MTKTATFGEVITRVIIYGKRGRPYHGTLFDTNTDVKSTYTLAQFGCEKKW